MSIASLEMFLMLCQKFTQSPGEPCTPKPDLFPWQDLPLLLLVLRINRPYISVFFIILWQLCNPHETWSTWRLPSQWRIWSKIRLL